VRVDDPLLRPIPKRNKERDPKEINIREIPIKDRPKDKNPNYLKTL